MMGTEEARDLFSEAFEDDLDEARKKAFQDALASDEELKAEYDDFVETFQLVSRLGDDDAVEAPDLLHGVQERLRKRSRGRYYRDRKGGSMLGPVQLAWLKETLKNSKGTFKVIASPVPFTEGIKPGSKDPWDGYPEEREFIFSFIESEKIDGVFLVAADRHRTDLRTTERPNGYTLYEFESSRLTNRHTHKVVETPGLIWGYSKLCSFGLMKFDTTAEDPTVTFECVTINGDVMETYSLPVSRLKH